MDLLRTLFLGTTSKIEVSHVSVFLLKGDRALKSMFVSLGTVLLPTLTGSIFRFSGSLLFFWTIVVLFVCLLSSGPFFQFNTSIKCLLSNPLQPFYFPGDKDDACISLRFLHNSETQRLNLAF